MTQAAVKAQIEAGIDKLAGVGTYAGLCEQSFGIDHSKYYLLEDSAQPEINDGEAAQEAGGALPENEGSTPDVYTDSETVRIVQQALNDAGFSCGPADGDAGDMTSRAKNHLWGQGACFDRACSFSDFLFFLACTDIFPCVNSCDFSHSFQSS